MPTRAKHHDFEPSEQFGLRYSATGKLVKISDPEARGKEAITYTNCLDIFDLAEALDIELTEEQAQEEAERIYENRKQFYNNHGYMKKKAIGEAYDGPVFNDDSLYRRSNGEKYTVRPDGSLESKAGKIIKEPNFEGFVHTFPRKHERTATFKEGRPRKDAAPVLTLPKQDNPLVQGECKTRTPEEASRSAAKQREQARKEAAKTTEEEKAIVKEHYLAELTDKEIVAEAARRGICPIEAGLQGASALELIEELHRRGYTTEATKTTAPQLQPTTDKDLAGIPTEALKYELEIRGELPPYASLDGFDDKDLADELRRRGYEVTATKTVEI